MAQKKKAVKVKAKAKAKAAPKPAKKKVEAVPARYGTAPARPVVHPRTEGPKGL